MNNTPPHSPVKRARARNPAGEGSRLRDELIAAAGRLLACGGDPEALTLRAVAREAGISAPSVYLRFESKDALLTAVVSANFAQFQQAIEAAIATGTDPATRLFNGCRAYGRFANEHPGAFRVIFELPLPEWTEIREEHLPGMSAFQVLVDSVAACIESGVANPGDPFAISTDIWSALHGMATLRNNLPGFPWPDVDRQLAGILQALTGIPYLEQIDASA